MIPTIQKQWYICRSLLHYYISIVFLKWNTDVYYFFNFTSLLLKVYDEIKGCREVQNSVLMPSLKWVTINFVVIRENELKVIKYLLKHAKGLQKMTISNASNDDIKEIKEYENASGVELIFRIREWMSD